nr:oral cancer-overexpressed protein 1 isoform X1 [Meriones unguiculatus]
MAGLRGPGESRDSAVTVEQDMFDAVVMADERFHGEGFQEGYEEGSSLGILEGRQYGTVHGAQIGSEIGCYWGFALAWKCLLHGGAGDKDSGPRCSSLQFPRGSKSPLGSHCSTAGGSRHRLVQGGELSLSAALKVPWRGMQSPLSPCLPAGR